MSGTPGPRPRKRSGSDAPTGPAPAAGHPAAGGGHGRGRFLSEGLRTPGVVGAAGVVALGFLGSRLLGLVRSAAIAHAFGTQPELAAYWVAFRLPDLVFQVLAGATLSAAFIPIFSRVALRGGERASWRLASNVLNLVSVATFLLAGASFLLAPWIVPLLAPGLGSGSGDAEQLRALAVQLTRLMLISPLLFGVSGMITGILNARQHFLAPALAPMIYNAAIIVGAITLAGPLGVRGLALAVVVGSAGHLLVQLPALRAVGMRWAPTLNLAAEDVREVLRLMGPRVVGLAAWQINLVVVVFFASFVSDEAISAVNYAFMLAMLPVGVIGMALATAIFPALAQQAASQQFGALRQSVAGSLRVVLFLAVPASAGLIVLARPAVRLLFQRGAFDAGSTDLVVAATTITALGIAATAGIEILSRGFYALADTRTPVLQAVVAMVLNVALCALLVAPFGIRGLAAAVSLSAIAEFLLLLGALDRRLGGLGRGLGRSALRTLLATAAMAEVLILMLLVLGAAGLDGDSTGGALLLCAGGAVVGGCTYLLAALAVSSEEATLLVNRLPR